MEDQAIVALYLARDEGAIAATDRAYGPYCRAIARNILPSPEDAEECVSDAYFAAWRSIPPQKPRRLAAYLGRLTRNLALNRFRALGAEKRGGGQTALALSELGESVPAPSDTLRTMEPALPAGYARAGESECGPFYASAQEPAWVYVWQEVYTDGTVDAHGTLNPAPPHHAYVRYVDSRLRGRYLICRDGRLYEPLLGADAYPDLLKAYGPRIEGDLPAGFVSLGTAAFSGLDTVPGGALSCNTESAEVFADPADDRVLLLPVTWYTAPQGDGEVEHHGFTVYVPCVDKALLEMVE